MTEPKNPDRHATRSGVLGRPDPELRDKAQDILAAHGWTMNDFLVACLVLLTKNPDPMLKRLAGLRPEPKKPGRPKKRDGQSPS